MNTDGEEPDVPMAKEILSYFLRNPGAADSLTEIVRWRLTQEAVRRNVEAADAALSWLTAQGYIREESRVGAERLFVLNPQRRNEAESFLKDEAGEHRG